MERLGAVARLEQERAPGRDLGERGLQLARLAGEDERRQRLQALDAALGARGVGPLRLLERRNVPPGGRGPGGIEHGHRRQCRRRGRDAKLGTPCGSSPASSPPARSTSATTSAASASTRRRRSSAAGGDAFFCIVDLHSITVDYDPADLRERTLDLAALLFATGLDPDRSTVFAQSHVTAHAEAAWLLSAVTSYGQLGRMTQFKEKGERQEFVSAGLFTYPVLMAADILLYQTDHVPVGDDQRQHLELARDIAERFNTRFGETFVVPGGRSTRTIGARIMDLQEPTKKMSTTGGTPQGTVLMLDPPDVIRKKVQERRSPTPAARCAAATDKPGVTNLIEIMSVATGESAEAIEARYDGGGYGQFKGDVAEAVSRCSSRSRRATPSCAATRASWRGCSRSARRRPARHRRRRSRAMYERMGFVRPGGNLRFPPGAPFRHVTTRSGRARAKTALAPSRADSARTTGLDQAGKACGRGIARSVRERATSALSGVASERWRARTPNDRGSGVCCSSLGHASCWPPRPMRPHSTTPGLRSRASSARAARAVSRARRSDGPLRQAWRSAR